MAAGSLLDDCRFALRVTGGNQRETLSKLTGRGSSGKQEGGLPFYYAR